MTDQFENWLRDTIPDVPVNETRKEIHLAILKERLRARRVARHRRYVQHGMLAIPVLLLVLFVSDIGELGSDGFSLIPVEDAKTPGSIMQNEFRGDGFNAENFATAEEAQEYNQQLATGEGIVVGVEGWEIRGETEWTVQKVFNISGKAEEMGFPLENPPSSMPPDLFVFLTKYWGDYEPQIKSGAVPCSGTTTRELDGELYTVQYWQLPTTELGLVRYYSGKPNH